MLVRCVNWFHSIKLYSSLGRKLVFTNLQILKHFSFIAHYHRWWKLG